MSITARKQPIADLIAHQATPESLKQRLQYAAAAREFAARELGLPDNGSYKSYVALEHRYVAWNVFAAPEFSLQPRQWCFPIAGCVVYRGYFREAAAQRYAVRLAARGYDATVAGVPAYSTLGHFDDPVMSSMLAWSDAQLAGTLIHELAHQVVYVPGDSTFNESFATAVEEAGLAQWLAQRGAADELQRWRRQQERAQAFRALLRATRDRLQVLYDSPLSDEAKRARKLQEFGVMKFEYWRLKQRWNGYAGYDAWFDRALNNADLAAVAVYEACVPGFQRLLASVDGEWPRFYAEVKRLARLDAEARRRAVCEAGPDLADHNHQGAVAALHGEQE